MKNNYIKYFNINDYPKWGKKFNPIKESQWFGEFSDPFRKIILNKKDKKCVSSLN